MTRNACSNWLLRSSGHCQSFGILCDVLVELLNIFLEGFGKVGLIKHVLEVYSYKFV